MQCGRSVICVVVFVDSWHPVAQLVEALRYQPEGRGFDFRSYHWNFSFFISFRPAVTLKSTQPLTEMSTSNSSWRSVKADILLSFMCRLS